MPTRTFDVPEGPLSALRLSPDRVRERDARGGGAALVLARRALPVEGCGDRRTSRAEFIEELAHRRIPVVQVTVEELECESQQARSATL
jgi:hypothetical protein